MNIQKTLYITVMLSFLNSVYADGLALRAKIFRHGGYDPNEGIIAVYESYYTELNSTKMLNRIGWHSEIDLGGASLEARHSMDNGLTWGSFDGQLGSSGASIWIDPVEKICVSFSHLMNSEYVQTGVRLSDDGAFTVYYQDYLISKGLDEFGNPYTAEHPFPGVYYDKNAAYLGASGCQRPIRLSNGNVLFPVHIRALDSNGNYYLPGDEHYWYNSAVLIGEWVTNGLGKRILEFELSDLVIGDSDLTVWGLFEPTIMQMSDGKILMVMRGNNYNTTLPGRKWFSISEDNGRTWSTPAEWKYSDMTSFYSPSSCSLLFKHSNGKVYWIGNISEVNPYGPWGMMPRYPLVVGEVDQNTKRLIKSSVIAIDTRQPDESEYFELSNFSAIEDAVTKDIVVFCQRRFKTSPNYGDAYEYRIAVSPLAERLCGEPGTFYEKMDINHDCRVNLSDFAVLAFAWMECTDPNNPDCYNRWTKNSNDFDVKYEMDGTTLHSDWDVDNLGNCLATVNSGLLTFVGDIDGIGWIDNSYWQSVVASKGSWTVEFKVGPVTITGAQAAVNLAAFSCRGNILALGSNVLYWGPTEYARCYHNRWRTYRIAYDASFDRCYIWQDDVLIDSQAELRDDASKLQIGDFEFGDIAGTVDFDYVRFTSGAWAPPM